MPRRERAALSLEPQDIDERHWYYEERKGLCVVVEGSSLSPFYIPWRMVEASVRRRKAMIRKERAARERREEKKG